MACIWYLSKYVSRPGKGNAGGRGYLIMRELVRMGHQCVIITSNSNKLAKVPVMYEQYWLEKVDGVHMWWIRTLRYEVAKSTRRILSWLDFEWRLWRMPKASLPGPDAIVVSSLSLLTIVNGLLLRKRYGARLVLEIRDIWPLTIQEEGGFSRYNPLVLALALLEKLGYRHSDAIVGTMPNLGEHVEEVLGRSKPTYCIPMGVDVGALGANQEHLPPSYVETYIPDDKFIVAHAGTIGITNALDTFLDCAEKMAGNPEMHFLVVGEGDLREFYQRKYAHLPNLTFAPCVTKNMVQDVLALCDVLYFSVHASAVWRFGQSLNKVIDYMLAGKPIVASYTGFPSMINDAGCGSFVPADDVNALREELGRYFCMPVNEREKLGAKGRAWILANRSYTKLAKDYEQILLPR